MERGTGDQVEERCRVRSKGVSERRHTQGKKNYEEKRSTMGGKGDDHREPAQATEAKEGKKDLKSGTSRAVKSLGRRRKA